MTLTCELLGGLGNQLFQIFTTITYSIRTKNAFYFLNQKETVGCTKRNTYWDSFLSNLAPFLKPTHFNEMVLIKEPKYTYTDLELNNIRDNNVILYGYFQSYKYFDNHKDIIERILKIDNKREQIVDKYKLDINDLQQTISMHFRYGDYLELQHIYSILDYDYYDKSIDFILQQKNKGNNNTNINNIIKKVLVFCEEKDYIANISSIVDKLREKYPQLVFEIIDFTISDWEQMLIFGLCKCNIIANSTFSWWAAYFNNNREKIICCPDVWFSQNSKNSIKDLYPPYWIKIKN